MLYDMGLEDIDLDPPSLVIFKPQLSMYPPLPLLTSILKTPSAAIQHNIPLRLTESPFLPPAAAAANQERIPHAFHIDPRNRTVVYLSPYPYMPTASRNTYVLDASTLLLTLPLALRLNVRTTNSF